MCNCDRPNLCQFEIDEITGCWNWIGSISPNGYGKVMRDRRAKLAHRTMWESIKGEIPKGLFVCHACDNRRCVNIDHLWLGTPRQNMHDMVDKGRAWFGPRLQQRHLDGTKHPGAKLTDDIVREIRKSTALQKDLAAQYGIGQGLISQIIRHKRWKHVT